MITWSPFHWLYLHFLVFTYTKIAVPIYYDPEPSFVSKIVYYCLMQDKISRISFISFIWRKTTRKLYSYSKTLSNINTFKRMYSGFFRSLINFQDSDHDFSDHRTKTKENNFFVPSAESSTKNRILEKSPVFLTQNFNSRGFNATQCGDVILTGDFLALCQSVENSADIKVVKKKGMIQW